VARLLHKYIYTPVEVEEPKFSSLVTFRFTYVGSFIPLLGMFPNMHLYSFLHLSLHFLIFNFMFFGPIFFEILKYTSIHSAAVDEFENPIQVVYYLSFELRFDGLVLCCAGIRERREVTRTFTWQLKFITQYKVFNSQPCLSCSCKGSRFRQYVLCYSANGECNFLYLRV
jgi:hypothetical protein